MSYADTSEIELCETEPPRGGMICPASQRPVLRAGGEAAPLAEPVELDLDAPATGELPVLLVWVDTHDQLPSFNDDVGAA
jgi:hypothetical protein